MPVKRPQLVNGEIYHVVLRGVGDTRIFKNKNDYYRAIFSLYEFNTTRGIEIAVQRRKRKVFKNKGDLFSDTRDYMVEIMAFAFMPNHIHLLFRQIKNNGITRFMQKFGAGYAAYFNKKYDRKGHLFQGRFKAVRIESNRQLQMVFVYIHTNPISLIEPHWKEKGIENSQEVIKFLETFKWSSHLDYIGKKNFPSLTAREFLDNTLGGAKGCKELIENWVKYKYRATNYFGEIALE